MRYLSSGFALKNSRGWKGKHDVATFLLALAKFASFVIPHSAFYRRSFISHIILCWLSGAESRVGNEIVYGSEKFSGSGRV